MSKLDEALKAWRAASPLWRQNVITRLRYDAAAAVEFPTSIDALEEARAMWEAAALLEAAAEEET